MLATAVIVVCAYPFGAVFVSASFEQAQGIGNVIIAYILGPVAFCILFVLQRTFYALERHAHPVLLHAVPGRARRSSVSLGCSLLPDGVDRRRHRPRGDRLRHRCRRSSPPYLLRRKIGGIDGRRILRSLTKYLVAAIIPVALGVWLLVALGGTHEGGFAVSGVFPAISRWS